MDEEDFEAFVEPAREVASHATSRGHRVVAICGAKGGVGATLVAANLSIYFASIGRTTAFVDGDPKSATGHLYLGLRSRPKDAVRGSTVSRPGTKVAEHKVGFSHLAFVQPGTEARSGRDGGVARRLGTWLRKTQQEYTVLDLGCVPRNGLLAEWLDAELPIVVLTPDPASLDGLYLFLRRAFMEHLKSSIDDDQLLAQLMKSLRGLGSTPVPADLLTVVSAGSFDLLADAVREAMRSFGAYFVLSRTRLRDDLELGDAIRMVVRRRMGLRVEYLGYVDEDDVASTCGRSCRAVLVESPGSKVGKTLEKLARRVLNVANGRTPWRDRPDVPENSHHDVLEVTRAASDEDIRRAFKRAKSVFHDESLACIGLFEEGELEEVEQRLIEAHDVLLDPARRVPYELSVFPPDETAPEGDYRVLEPKEPMPPAPSVTPDTQFDGSLLRAVRESQGVSLLDISRKTKVGVHHLEAIEGDDYAHLPAQVYVRGFVTEVARYLRLDAEQVARSYVRKYNRLSAPEAAKP